MVGRERERERERESYAVTKKKREGVRGMIDYGH